MSKKSRKKPAAARRKKRGSKQGKKQSLLHRYRAARDRGVPAAIATVLIVIIAAVGAGYALYPEPEGQDTAGAGTVMPAPATPAAAVPPAVIPEPSPPVPAWRQFAASAAFDPSRRQIAIIIDDVGLSIAAGREVMELTGPLTLSFLSYADNLQAQADRARAAGHEVMVHIPMEAGGTHLDPGPHALRTGMSRAEHERRLDWHLSRFSGFVGVNNHMGSRFTTSKRGMRVTLTAIRERGLLFVDSRTTAETVAKITADELGVPNTKRDVFIDEEDTDRYIRRELARIETVAAEQGYAVAIGHPRPRTVRHLRRWLAALDRERFQLVPVSVIIEYRDTRWKAGRGVAAGLENGAER